jgi:hypothetical protein
MSRYQMVGQKRSINIANGSFKEVVKFKYLGTPLMYQTCMHKEIKSRLNLGSACHHLVQMLFPSHRMYRNIKDKIFKTIILPVLLCVCVKPDLSH